MTYRREVQRGREQLCPKCRETIMLRRQALNGGRWTSLMLSMEPATPGSGARWGKDVVELAPGVPDVSETRAVVDAIADWTALKEAPHDHRELLAHRIKMLEMEVRDEAFALAQKRYELDLLRTELKQERKVRGEEGP